MSKIKKAALPVSLVLLIAAVWFASPREFIESVYRVGVGSFLLAALILIASMAISSIRFLRLLHMNGANVGIRIGLKAYFAGNVGTLFFLPLLGQAGARQALLAKAGVDPAVNTSIIVIERIATAAWSAGIALLSAVYLLGSEEVLDFVGSARVVPLALAMALAALFAVFVFGSAAFRDGSVRMVNLKLLLQGIEVSLITLAQFACMIFGFVVVGKALSPESGYVALIAVSSLVSFCASMPISVGGWGIREVAAIAFFGRIGFSAGDALAVTVTIGLMSMVLTVGIAYLVFYLARDVGSAPAMETGGRTLPPLRINAMSMMVPYMGAVAIFFQFYVSLPQGEISVNFADPFAMLALMIVVAEAIKGRTFLQWRMGSLNCVFLLLTGLIVWGIAVAVFRGGVMPQFLVSRGLGWLVLLGYVAMGALFIRSLGSRGFARATSLLAATACAVVVVEVWHRWLYAGGAVNLQPGHNFEGFSANRNAFVFAVLLVLCAVFANLRKLFRVSGASRRVWWWAVTLLSAAVLLSASRTGAATLAALFVAVMVFRLIPIKTAVGLMASSIALWFILMWSGPGIVYGKYYVSEGLRWVGQSISLAEPIDPEMAEERRRAAALAAKSSTLQSPVSSDSADFDRVKINSVALDLFRETPILGQGLGKFYEKSPELLGIQYVIHNTWLWILVEFGAVGASMAVACVGLLFWHIYRFRLWKGGGRDVALVLGLLCFGLFTMMHEIAFQRILWFGLGLVMAVGRFHGVSRVAMSSQSDEETDALETELPQAAQRVLGGVSVSSER